MYNDPYIQAMQPTQRRLTSRIIAINVLVFLLWLMSDASEHGFMARNFLVSWTAVREGRLWTVFTSIFSHATFLHLFLNMIVLRSFGSVMEEVLGQRHYFRFFLAAGAIASLFHCAVSTLLLGAPQLSALGASGAISGLVVLFALMFPAERILFFGFIPIPALFAVAIIVGMDLWGLIEQVSGAGLPIGYGAHIGGALTGFFYYALVARRPVPVEEG